jgi:hypothetical protein
MTSGNVIIHHQHLHLYHPITISSPNLSLPCHTVNKVVINTAKPVSNSDKRLLYISLVFCQLLGWPLGNTEPRRSCQYLGWLAAYTETLSGGFVPRHSLYVRAMHILSNGIATAQTVIEMAINHCSSVVANMKGIVHRLSKTPPFKGENDEYYIVTKHKLCAVCVGHRYELWRCLKVLRTLQFEQASSEAVRIDQRYVLEWIFRAAYLARRTNTRMDVLLENKDWLLTQSHRSALVLSVSNRSSQSAFVLGHSSI